MCLGKIFLFGVREERAFGCELKMHFDEIFGDECICMKVGSHSRDSL